MFDTDEPRLNGGRLRPVRIGAGVAGAAVLLVLVLALGPVAVPLLAIGAALVLSLVVRPGLLFALGLAATVFSGYSDQLGLPIGADRVLILAGLAGLALGLPIGHAPRPRIRLGPVHLALGAAAAAGIISAAAAGALTDTDALFALFDRLGLVPFLFFVLAPVLYPGRRERNYLLVVLVVVGYYLGFTALLEGLGLKELAWPSYISDPSVGFHLERARGPFAEAVANGLAMWMCLAAASVAVVEWRSRVAKVTAGLLVPLLLFGILFTVTRAVWLAALLGLAVVLAIQPGLRRRAPGLLVLAAAAVIVAFVAVPGFRDLASERSAEQRPVWARLDSNAAALDAALDRPLTGVGWQQFRDEGQDYLWQADDRPLVGQGIEVHNVFLSHAAEIGFLGLAAWSAAFVLGVVVPCVRRPPPELAGWRYGLVAIVVAWFAVASFGPLSYAFPNLLLWTWAGIVAGPWTTEPAPDAP